MSVTKQTTVWCDERDCPEWVIFDQERTAYARSMAVKEGWSREGLYDFCPDHTKQRKERARAVRQLT